MSRALQRGTDGAMYVIFLYLMSYRPGQGLLLHGILGCVLFALFFLHHLWNRRWFHTVLRGRYGPARLFFDGTNLLLFAAMCAMVVSSVLMSGEIFSFSPFMQTQFARTLHAASAAWGFVLMILHVGLHTHGALARLGRIMDSTVFAYVYRLLYGAAAAGGLWLYFQSPLFHDMFLIPKGNVPFSPLAFYGEYLFITIAACLLVHLAMDALSRARRRKLH